MDWPRLTGLLLPSVGIGFFLVYLLINRWVFRARPGLAFILGMLLAVTIAYAGGSDSTRAGVLPLCFVVFMGGYAIRMRMKK